MIGGVQEMLEPEAVTTIVRLGQSGRGAKRIAGTLGIAHTVRRYLNVGGPVAYRQPQSVFIRLPSRLHYSYACACSLTPSARATFGTVAKLGFPSSLSAR